MQRCTQIDGLHQSVVSAVKTAATENGVNPSQFAEYFKATTEAMLAADAAGLSQSIFIQALEAEASDWDNKSSPTLN